jgi:arylsulfatase A-like enzyme
MLRSSRFPIVVLTTLILTGSASTAEQPNIVLVMADDMGWGQTGYYNHPVLKTPNLDAMADNGLRFDRFYAGAPNCSPTRATVMTGRTNDRTGVLNHGVPLRPQERTIAQGLAAAGYATGHFGKWHLNGLRGIGVPVLKSDIRSPGHFGFQTWLSVTNFFDRDPLMGRMGEFEQFQGDSSEIVVDEALMYIKQQAALKRPSFTVVWYGTPHSPFIAVDDDKSEFAALDKSSANHYGELVAMDRSIGTLRKGLRELAIADNTLLWFCGDNGGLGKITPETVGGLRGLKNSVYEGGLRVPAVLEWPDVIKTSRITTYPACTTDIFPTLADIVGLPKSASPLPQDGVTLKRLLTEDLQRRERPLGFRHTGRTAFIDNNYKLLNAHAAGSKDGKGAKWELYDLEKDHHEDDNLIDKMPDVAARLKSKWAEWNASIEDSIAGLDYPEGKVVPADPGPGDWEKAKAYQPYLNQLEKYAR